VNIGNTLSSNDEFPKDNFFPNIDNLFRKYNIEDNNVTVSTALTLLLLKLHHM
jgi:hypothetical protein